MAPATRPNLISNWKKQFLQGAACVFETAGKPPATDHEPEIAVLYEQIGRLQMELTFFKKNRADFYGLNKH